MDGYSTAAMGISGQICARRNRIFGMWPVIISLHKEGEGKVSIQYIQQAINYMEEHIYEDINYAKVAESVHMSNYNFHRTFSFIVGMTANEYIRKRRLTLAAQELQSTDLSVIDAAFKYG